MTQVGSRKKDYTLIAILLANGICSLLTDKISGSHPVLLYDDDCRICSRFARIAWSWSRGWIDTVGLFTDRGRRMKSAFFRAGDRPDEMFWILIGDTGYGGRSGLLPLAREIIRGRVL